MLNQYLKKENILIDVEAATPEEAISAAGMLLVNSNSIHQGYIDDMIDVYHTLGSYIVIAPGIAFPHGKPGEKVYKTCISFCKLHKPIRFNHPQNDPVEFIFALGGKNEIDHLDMLKELSMFLMNPENLYALKDIQCVEDMVLLLSKGGVE